MPMEDRKQILVVDDTAISLTAIERALCDDYDVVTVNSGTRALRYIQDQKPDLILLDINMANKDGIETLREMRGMPNGKDIPVIMLTGIQKQDSVVKALTLGIYDYILKPFDPEDLRKRIQHVWKKLNGEEDENEKRKFY